MGEHGHHSPNYYIRIYFYLLGLFAISVAGPVIADTWFTAGDDINYSTTGVILVLTTAFGVAFVKAYLVAAKFMHLDVEKPVVWYILITCLAFMVLFFAAVSPDVQNHSGNNWENVGAKQAVEAGIVRGKKQMHHHGDEHHGDEAGHGEDHGDAHDKGDHAHEKEGADHH